MNRVWPFATLALGLATFIIVFAFGALPQVLAAYPHGEFTRALGAFQRASTPTDLDAVFGAPANPAIIAAMQAGNTLDLYAFIPIYTLFLASGAALLAGGVSRPLVWFALAPLLVGLVGDLIETTTQLRMTADVARASALLPVAPWCWTKFFGLAFQALGASAICLLGAQKRFILAGLGALPLVATFANFLSLAPSLAMTAAFGAYWVGLIVIAILSLRFAARDVSP